MLREELQTIDKLIREGKAAKAREIIEALVEKDISPKEILDVCRLARRAILPFVALKLLHPIVRPGKKILRAATPEDIAEYAASLQRVGSIAEAEQLLESVSPETVPSAYLFRAFCRMKEWDYSAALPLLRSYVRCPLSEYELLTGKTNLVSVLIFEGHLNEAKSLLAQVLEQGQGLLHGIALQYRGNIEFQRKNYDQAISLFEVACQSLGQFGGLEHFFAQKWKAIAQMYLTNDVSAIQEVKKKAQEVKHWESFRDLDFHQALVEQNSELLAHVYFGTPHLHYKKHVLRSAPWFTPKDSYFLEIGPAAKSRETVEIGSEERTKKGEFLKRGQSVHRLYHTLLSDFYRPFSLVTLFEKIFDDEAYRPSSSEARVHQAIKRLRAWFKKNDIALTINLEGGDYRLEATAAVQIPISSKLEVRSSFYARLEVVKDSLPNEFTLKQAAELLGLSRRAAADFVQRAMNENIMLRKREGAAILYFFAPPKVSQKAA
jgi:tetratricopeptide (TPR) repeat protein